MTTKGAYFVGLAIIAIAWLALSGQAIAQSKMYWTDSLNDTIQRANLDGTDVEELFTKRFSFPSGLALDVAGGKMYFTVADGIQRANLDGSGVEDLVAKQLSSGPNELALDVAGSKMYWTDVGFLNNEGSRVAKIQRANLDGSAVEDLVTAGLDNPLAIVLDVAGGKMYWTDIGPDKIQRANLDGSGIEDLVTTGLGDPYGLALDIEGGQMYWTDWGTDKIQRANLDGDGIEDLIINGLIGPSSIALDVVGGKMYWTDRGEGPNKVQRANLDGSGVEDLVTAGLTTPDSIALDLGGTASSGPPSPGGTGAADLTGEITKVKAKLRPAGDHKLNVKVQVRNDGTGIASGPFSISSFLSDDGTFDLNEDELLDTEVLTEDLLPGETSSTIKLKKKGLPPVTGFAIVRIDDDDDVAESDEQNNLLVQKIVPVFDESVLQFGLTDMPETPLVAVQSDGAAFFLEHDTLQDRIHAITFLSKDRDTLTLWVGDEGFPTRAEVGGHVILFANYSPTTVDIAVISPEGEGQLFPGTPLDTDAKAFVEELAAGVDTARALSSSEGVLTRALGAVGDSPPGAFGFFRKAASFVGSLQPLQELENLAVAPVITSFRDAILKPLTQSEDVNAVVDILDNAWSCATDTGPVSKFSACVQLVVGALEDVRDLLDINDKIAQMEELLRQKEALQARASEFPEAFNPFDSADPRNQHQTKELPTPVITIVPPGPIAPGDEVVLNGSGSFAAASGDSITDWKWEIQGPDEVLRTTIDCCDPDAATSRTSVLGTHFVFLTVTDINGLQNTRRKAVKVEIPQQLTVTLEFPDGDSSTIQEPPTPTGFEQFTAVRARLSEATDKDAVVTIALSGNATRGEDYAIQIDTENTLRIVAGEVVSQSGFFTIDALEDNLTEEDETIVIEIVSVENAIAASGPPLTIVIKDRMSGDTPGDTVTLTVTKAGAGAGTVTSVPSGINCGLDCSEDVTIGTMLTLTATPTSSSTFAGWSVVGCSGTAACVVDMQFSGTVTATFNLSAGGSDEQTPDSVCPAGTTRRPGTCLCDPPPIEFCTFDQNFETTCELIPDQPISIPIDQCDLFGGSSDETSDENTSTDSQACGLDDPARLTCECNVEFCGMGF